MSRFLTGVFAALDELQLPADVARAGQIFSAARYPGSQYHRLGKNQQGHIAVLISLDPRYSSPLAPVVLDNINVLHGATCRVSEADGTTESGLYTVVSCTSQDRALIRHFVTLMSSLVLSLEDRPSSQTAAAAIRQTIRLFRAIRRPSSRTVQGLWAEMFVISVASNPKALVRAWRFDPMEQFDFAHESERLEVKSTKWPRRTHLFSQLQLRPAANLRVVIASVRVASLSNGYTLANLWHRVRSLVEDVPSLLLHVDRVVTTSLGRAWRRGLNVAFDETVARNTMAFYLAETIPAVQGVQPIELTEIKYRCDLSQVEAISSDQIAASGQLAVAAVPQQR